MNENVSKRTSNDWALAARWFAALLGTWMAAASAEAGLVHRWSFNDGTANDSVGNADGTVIGNASISGGKAVLNPFVPPPLPAAGYINLPSAEIAINQYVDATFEGWFTFAGFPWQRLFDFGQPGTINPPSSDARYYIYFTPHGSPGGGPSGARAAISVGPATPHAGFFYEDAASGGVLPNGPIPGTPEFHAAVVFDNAANGGSGRMSIYINGAFQGDVVLTRSLSGVSNAAAYLGKSMYAYDPAFSGSINEFRLYNEALSAQAIAHSYALGPNGVPEPGSGVLVVLSVGALLGVRVRR